MGMEFSGQTLRKLAQLDPLLIQTLKSLIQDGLIEPICGGEYQSIGPLMPSRDNLFNYQTGKETFRTLLDWDADLLYLPEQTVSRGLLDAIVKSGFKSVLLEWNNTRRYGALKFSDKLLYRCPQLDNPDARPLRILWNHYVVSQKVQRCVYGDIPLDEVSFYIMKHSSRREGYLCLYGSDLEVFGYYPGSSIQKDSRVADARWRRFKELVLKFQGNSRFALPSKIVDIYPLGKRWKWPMLHPRYFVKRSRSTIPYVGRFVVGVRHSSMLNAIV